MITTIPMEIDKYQIIKPLGSGCFGQVYHVLDRALSEEKAIKVLFCSDTSEFMHQLQEAQIQNKCQHKHIVSINEANIFPVNGTNRVVLDLEYIPEGSLEAALSMRWVSIRESVQYIRGALLGLEHAHAHGFLHRDVKPGNILLSPNAPKLSDFGLATAVGDSLAGSAKGYRTHLPPECYRTSSTSEQTDIFAMGMTLFRSLTNIADWLGCVNRVPNYAFHMEKGTLVQQIGFADFLPDTIRSIVRKACHLETGKRFATARDFGQSLDKLRFNINWIREDGNTWRGECSAGKQHTCHTDPANNNVTVTINGRRDRSKCSNHTSLEEAVKQMHRHIAETTVD